MHKTVTTFLTNDRLDTFDRRTKDKLKAPLVMCAIRYDILCVLTLLHLWDARFQFGYRYSM